MSDSAIETIKSTQREHFDRVAAEYSRKIDQRSYDYYFGFTKRAVLGALTRNCADLSRLGGLDLGCGVGDFTAAIAEHCASMVGTDISAGMIESARNTHDAVNLEFRASAADKIDFADASFDFSLSIHLLHHLAEESLIRTTLHEMKRVTKPGGLVVIVDVNKLNPVSPLIQYLMVRRGVDTGDERLVNPYRVRAMFAEVGIALISHAGFCFVPHVVPSLARYDETVGRILPDKLVGKDYIIVGRNV